MNVAVFFHTGCKLNISCTNLCVRCMNMDNFCNERNEHSIQCVTDFHACSRYYGFICLWNLSAREFTEANVRTKSVTFATQQEIPNKLGDAIRGTKLELCWAEAKLPSSREHNSIQTFILSEAAAAHCTVGLNVILHDNAALKRQFII